MEKRKTESKEVRPAATVILAREHEGELQVYLLQRNKKSGFFPGNYVFPGGVLDPEDGETGLLKDHMDLDTESLSRRLGGGLDGSKAMAYAVAVIRETFEEAGVFIAEKTGGTPEDFRDICALRDSNRLFRGWIRDRVVPQGWRLAVSRLTRWSHWITPEAMPRRFDTRFFLTFMPNGQECVPDNRETVHGVWISPKNGLEGNHRGEIPLSPPTLITLFELLEYKNFDQLKKEAPNRTWGEPRLPIFIRYGGGAVIIQPWDPHYGKDIEVDPDALKEKVLPVGEPFSRIWLHDGIWRPISEP